MGSVGRGCAAWPWPRRGRRRGHGRRRGRGAATAAAVPAAKKHSNSIFDIKHFGDDVNSHSVVPIHHQYKLYHQSKFKSKDKSKVKSKVEYKVESKVESEVEIVWNSI